MNIDIFENIDVVMDRGVEMIGAYINDPVLAAIDLLNVDLAPIQRILLRDMWSKNFTISIVSRGGGKSSAIDSLSLIQDKGLCYLYEEFDHVPSFLQSGETMEVTSDQVIYTANGFNSINKVSLEKDIEGMSLTTQYGFIHKGSYHHPLLTMDVNGNFYYKQLQDFSVGDYVCIQRGQNVFGNHTISDDDAYLLGLFIGDGVIVDGYNHRSVTTSDKYIKDFCVNYCEINNIDYRIDRDKRTINTYSIIFKKFDWFFDKYSTKKYLSYYEEVPYIIRTSNRNTQLCFLRGLFDTGGGFEKKGVVTFCSTSEKLVKEIQMMLLNLGIISRIKEKNTKSMYGKEFILVIGYDDILFFRDIIGFNLERKSVLLDGYLMSKELNTNKNTIPFIKDTIVMNLATKYKSKKAFGNKFNGRYGFESRINLSYSMLAEIIGVEEFRKVDVDIYDKLVNIYKYNYYFDTVKEVKNWHGDCYDFKMSAETDTEPNYFCNGFINHNTFLLGVNAALHALLYPGYRIGLISSSFRQAKYIFAEVEKLYAKSSILREACEKRPIRGSDSCYLKFKGTDNSNGSYIEAVPLGVDGAKIRGSRFYLVEIDELAQVPSQIIDMVIRPFGAVSLEPMQKVRYLERMDMLIRQGLATEDDIIKQGANKMVMTSSGYFKFNHMWKRMKAYWGAMKEEGSNSKYAVHQVPYTMLPKGFLDEENIKEAVRTMSSFEFMMEYGASMISDSDGFFKASLLENCTNGSNFGIRLNGEKGKEYVLGVDPSQGGSASCGLVIIEIGNLNRIVFVRGIKKKTTQEMTVYIQELTDKFNVKGIFMDSQGGGKPIRDLLQEGYNGHIPILDIDDENSRGKDGKRILQLVNPSPSWISDANFDTLALIENEHLRFPEVLNQGSNVEEKLYEEIRLLKSQMLNIVVTETSRGVRHFDTPKKGQNKDLYSALILAAWGVREFSRQVKEEIVVLSDNGLVRSHSPGSMFVQPSSFINSTSSSVGSFVSNKALLHKK